MPPGETAARGYGWKHQRVRKRWAAVVARGEALCHRCGQPIPPGSKWDLGHNDDRTGWTGPECVPCNRSAGGRNGAKATNTQRQITRRDW